MHILFIGGTRFVGLAMAREALRRGHQVDVFHRGKTAPGALPGARHLIGDRIGNLAALADGRWDAVIDTCGYRPGELHAVARALGGRGGKYVFVSSISAYAEGVPAHSGENAPLADAGALPQDQLDTVAIDGATYGPLKALCEAATLTLHSDAMIIRPTYVIGPDDYTKRFSEWVRRIAAGGGIDAPEPRHELIQTIDARDMAAFVIGAIEKDLRGCFNAAAAPMPFGTLLDTLVASVGASDTRLRWIVPGDADAAAEDFPLWGGGSHSGLGAVSNKAAVAHGLVCRPLAESARDVLAWLKATPAG